MRWLIVEDALHDRKGHWFEYLNTFVQGLRALGDEVTVLAERAAEPFLVEQLKVQPVLPASIWHRMGDDAGTLRRYLRVPVHAWQTYCVLKKYFQRDNSYDVVFIPTVLVHHLLGWTWLIKMTLRRTSSRILLFFPNTPIQLDPKDGAPAWLPTPTARLFCRLIRCLKNEVDEGRVILGVETEPMREALTRLTGVVFTYFPHPVEPLPLATEFCPNKDEIIMAAYGGARHEKGSDLIVTAVNEFCRRHPDSRVRFILQCVGGEAEQWEKLQGNPKIRLLANYFNDGEYARQLRATDVMLLPYRCLSYNLRVSRVAIESMINGIPVVVTRGTTLASQAENFGAAVLCEDGNVDSILAAIETVEINFESLVTESRERQVLTREHFSVGQFHKILISLK
jgi:glycosyltransferase involved in cell wall biosynthesis